MSLSVASRRRYQTATASASASAATSLAAVRKQHSLIDQPASHVHGVGKYTAQQRGYLSRGLSVGRSIENIRQKLYPTSTTSGHLSRQSSLAIEDSACRITGRLAPAHTDFGLRLRDKGLVAWPSTSSLTKTPRAGDSISEQRLLEDQKEAQLKTDNAKADKNRINLNIVLAQTIRATNEQETVHSDIESATESSEPGATAAAVAAAAVPGAAGVRAESTLSVEDTVSSVLTVQRRPPLVRAMSAPVRLDESKCVIGGATVGGKRGQQKLRRRKIFSRAASSVAGPPDASPLLSASDAGKKQLSRARSVIAPDVITLVSLLSSEGSDSEREDNSAATTPTGNENQSSTAAQRSPQRRAPLLRKTGKSVSFQDSYPPTFQLASKEYSHMIRRASIAPLAARIRANRPPTAPPVSIFINESANKPGSPMETRPRQTATPEQTGAADLPVEEDKKENNAANCNVQQPQQEYNYPVYVCSLKERECWKLHQKMCAKGVNVSYETVLRGMLTPTEFRQYQKQREHEDARAQEAAEAEAEAAAAAEKDNKKTPSTAIERLSEALLQSK